MLTDLVVRGLKPADRPYKKADQHGLYLLITPNGSKLWRMKFRFDGREQMLSFGPYPRVSLAEARARCQDARHQLRNKVNPATALRGAVAGENTVVSGGPSFETVARDWYAAQAPGWRARHADDVIHSLDRDVFPTIGAVPLDTLTQRRIYEVVHEIEARGAVETAHRVRQRISAVFTFAIAKGICQTDPAATIGRALKAVVKGRMPAVVDIGELREMLRKAEAERCHPATKLALRLLALTVLRPGGVQLARWEQFDLTSGPPLWRITAEDMKTDETHTVPLPARAVDVIEAVRTVSGRLPYLFPNSRHAHKPISENAIGYLLNRAGFHHRHVPHGFRSSFSSIMTERYPMDVDAIECCLARKIPGVRGRYMRADFNGRRRELMEEWAELLFDGFAPAASLLEGPRR